MQLMQRRQYAAVNSLPWFACSDLPASPAPVPRTQAYSDPGRANHLATPLSDLLSLTVYLVQAAGTAFSAIPKLHREISNPLLGKSSRCYATVHQIMQFSVGPDESTKFDQVTL